MEEQLHYLLLATHTMMQKQIYARLRDLGLTMGQPKVLDYLLSHDGAIQKEIANGCYIEPPSLSVILNGMEKSGLIQRRADGENRRNVRIFLTRKGMELGAKVRQEITSVESAVLREIDAEQLSRFLGDLKRIRAALEETDE